jgi:quinol monooxygenase YgiN
MSTPVTFFNIIRVPEGKESETLAVWKEISDLMEASSSCLSTKLHRNRRNPHLLINYAQFTSTEAFIELSKIEQFRVLSKLLTDLGVEREAGVYDVISTFTKDEA